MQEDRSPGVERIIGHIDKYILSEGRRRPGGKWFYHVGVPGITISNNTLNYFNLITRIFCDFLKF